MNTLYNYELDDLFYEEMLADQLTAFNRYEFKQIVAHMIYFKNVWSDKAVELICRVCEIQHIGYSFVQIFQFVKANSIDLSMGALDMVTATWYKFKLINEDMMSFMREYCRAMNKTFKTSFYSQYCAHMIKTKDFEKLEVLFSAVLLQIRPKPFKVDNSMKASEVPALEKEWKAKQ